MRLAIGIALIDSSVVGLRSGRSMEVMVLSVVLIGAGLLLLAGLWTPIAGTLVALIELWEVFLLPQNLWLYILMGTLGAALAMLGPGTWSVDARLFGWKRVPIRDRDTQN